MAKSMTRVKNVTLDYFFHLSSKEIGHLSGKDIIKNSDSLKNCRFQTVNSSGKNIDDSMLPKAYSLVTNLPIISRGAVNYGYFNIIHDSDGSMHWLPLVVKMGDDYYSSLSLSVLHQSLDWPLLSLNLASYSTENIKIDDTVIPTDEVGRLLINYMGPAKTFRHYFICDIIKGKIHAENLRDKIVLIWGTAIGIYDLWVTTFGATYPGVGIHATAIDNILHRNFLIYSGFTKFFDICIIIMFGLRMGLIVSCMKAVKSMFFAEVLIGIFMAINMFLFTSCNA
jgi:adenylate cyclase